MLLFSVGHFKFQSVYPANAGIPFYNIIFMWSSILSLDTSGYASTASQRNLFHFRRVLIVRKKVFSCVEQQSVSVLLAFLYLKFISWRSYIIHLILIPFGDLFNIFIPLSYYFSCLWSLS